MKHSILSASGANRWINCPPSARLELEQGVEEKSSVYAEEGSLAHELAELELNFSLYNARLKKRTYNARLKKIKSNTLYKEEMIDFVGDYVSKIQEIISEKKDPTILIEEKFDLSEWIKEGFGTGDCVIIDDGVLEIIDFKYGQGVKVNPEDNTQLKIYGLGAYFKYEFSYDISEVRLTIVQPRLGHIESWVIQVKDLLDWGDKILKPAAELAWEGKGVQKAGEHCRWCKIKARCATLASFSLKEAKRDFSPHKLRDDQMVDIWHKIPVIKDWIKSVEEHMLEEALSGKIWKGLKVVEGRANRKWKDPDEVIKILVDDEGFELTDIANIKPKGISELQKRLKDEFHIVSNLVVKPEGKPVLVPESDKRPEFGTAKEDFSN